MEFLNENWEIWEVLDSSLISIVGNVYNAIIWEIWRMISKALDSILIGILINKNLGNLG